MGSKALAGLCSLIVSIGSCCAQYPGAVAPESEYLKGFKSISPTECRGWLDFLASRACDGRGTGQPGFQKAADFVASQFKKFGLKPLGPNGSYFQEVPFTRSRIDDKASFASIQNSSTRLTIGKDLSLRVSSDFDQTAPLAFARADSADELLPDPTVAKDKIVVVVGGKATTKLRSQVFRAGARGILMESGDPIISTWQVRPGQPRNARSGAPPRFTGTITPKAAKDLADGAGVDTAALFGRSAETSTASFIDAKSPLTIKVQVQTESIDAPNVVGLLPGSDPTGELVGIGAHLDHLGDQSGVIYPGADDDGSGITALLAIANAFHVNHTQPKRSILFMAFCGEELGLIGSGYYSSNPILPLSKMNCELQMDMVGRNSYGAQNGDPKRMDIESENVDTMRLVGSKRISTDLDKLIQDANKCIGFKFKYDSEDVYYRSDHYNFAKNGVPIAFMFDGFTPDYHQPTDTIDKINFDKIANCARLYYLVAERASNGPWLTRDVGTSN